MTDEAEPFSPNIWPADPVPPFAAECERCELSRQRRRIIWGEGAAGAPILALLDNPGAREDAQGDPFVCGTRQTLQRAVHEAGLLLQDVYVTYALKRRPIRAYDKPLSRLACSGHLEAQLLKSQPQYVLCLGTAAAQVWFSDETAQVKTLRGTWHSIRGIPTAVTYHPLAVRRRPNLWRFFLEDWKRIAQRYHASPVCGVPE